MVSASFDDARSKPKPGVNEPECIQLAQQLVDLILAGSDVVDTFRELTRGPADYSPYLSVIDNIKNGILAGATGPLQKDLDFYLALEKAYHGYSLKPDVWVDALGLIVEYSFLILMQQKYQTGSVDVYHEHTATLSVGGVTMTTSPKPIDVVMWCPVKDCGEFLEVKKHLDAKIRPVRRGDADSWVSKVDCLYKLLEFFSVQNSATVTVGLATLSRNPLVTTLLELTFRSSGRLGVNDSLAQLPYQLSIITSEELIDWYTKKVV